jgi:hypothetical protein
LIVHFRNLSLRKNQTNPHSIPIKLEKSLNIPNIPLNWDYKFISYQNQPESMRFNLQKTNFRVDAKPSQKMHYVHVAKATKQCFQAQLCQLGMAQNHLPTTFDEALVRNAHVICVTVSQL